MTYAPIIAAWIAAHATQIRTLPPVCPFCRAPSHAKMCPEVRAQLGTPANPDDGQRWAAIHLEMATRNAAIREQLATAHEVIGAARALLHELDASGNYPHSSVAIGVVLMALERATR